MVLECKGGLVSNLLLWWRNCNTSVVEKGQKHHREVLQTRSTEILQRLSTEEIEKSIIRNEVLLLVWNISVFSMTIVRVYLKKEKVTGLPHPTFSPDLALCDSFCFRNWNHSLLGGNTERHLDLSFISTLLLCPNQHTMTPLGSG